MAAPTSATYGGFDPGEMCGLLRRACARAGLDGTGAALLRGRTNAVVRLATAPVVVRIARRGTDPAAVADTVAFVRWLMERGFPTVPLHPAPARQPVVVDGHAVTFWTHLPQPGHPPGAAQIAPPLRSLHALAEPPLRPGRLNVPEAIRASLAATASLPDPVVRFLTERLERLTAALRDVGFVLPEGVVHGDAGHHNALHAGGGRAVLCDWDTVAYGQPEWDLAMREVHCRRSGHGPARCREFAAVYGFDVVKWPGFPVLRDLCELKAVTSDARRSARTPAIRAEVERCVAALRRRRSDGT
ncbi:phosphotransferase [Streptomyces caatingaensis]|uniref:Aminoglycoside phosphotransferase domain-containing protein n=1 Tax=Streptomyces caatingaensis TaxID=1678637 RepID=A0A0K9XIV9_9ACTN|nr:phosphotransferase [Streptomyces caatingaensis]KNB53223.1 hypothetical protein AC230_07195 [Streptomyces caatingaensis]